MAAFKPAYDITHANEGAIADDPNDLGGFTAYGISRKNWPRWEGWALIDKGDRYDTSEELRKMVWSFYKTNFWDKFKGDLIHNQSIANLIYDQFVNSGFRAIEQLQTVLGVKSDGIVGPQTIAALNAGCQQQIFDQYKLLREKFYRDRVKNSPSQSKFLKGWLNRLSNFQFN